MYLNEKLVIKKTMSIEAVDLVILTNRINEILLEGIWELYTCDNVPKVKFGNATSRDPYTAFFVQVASR